MMVMMICYVILKKRGEKLCDEEDRDKVVCLKINCGFCFIIFFLVGVKKKIFYGGLS